MVIECRALVTGHREDIGFAVSIGGSRLALSLVFGQVQGGEAGIEMEIQFVRVSGLTIGQAGKLLTIAKNEFNGLITNDKFCFVRRVNLQLNWSRVPLRCRPSNQT